MTRSRGSRKLGDEIFRFEREAFVLISDRQAPARLLQFLRNGPGDAAFIRKPENHRCLLRIAHSVSLPIAGLKPGGYKGQILWNAFSISLME